MGVGLLIGLSTNNLKPELAYLLVGLCLFGLGQLCLRKYK